MRILFLSRWFPYPINNGSKLRIYNLLRGLSQQHDVTLLSFVEKPEGSPEAHAIRAPCSEVHTVLWREFNPISFHALLGFLSLKPRSIIDTFSEEMAHKIQSLLNERSYDLVIASQLPMAAYHPYFRKVPALFEEVELGLSYADSLLNLSWQKRFRHVLTWFKLNRYLSRLFRSFQAITVVSERERDLVAKHFPVVKNISVIPNCVNVAEYANIFVEPKPNRLIFTGSFRYHANYEAMLWFVGKVFPRILKQTPDAELVITGDHADLPLPSDTHITRAGYVDNIKYLIASASVVLAPIWSGGGTRLKILEAMALGTPVVATTKGSEGLDVRNGEHLLVADDPGEFSTCVIRLLRDADLRWKIVNNAHVLLHERYDWGRILPDLLQLVEAIAVERTVPEAVQI